MTGSQYFSEPKLEFTKSAAYNGVTNRAAVAVEFVDAESFQLRNGLAGKRSPVKDEIGKPAVDCRQVQPVSVLKMLTMCGQIQLESRKLLIC